MLRANALYLDARRADDARGPLRKSRLHGPTRRCGPGCGLQFRVLDRSWSPQLGHGRPTYGIYEIFIHLPVDIHSLRSQCTFLSQQITTNYQPPVNQQYFSPTINQHQSSTITRRKERLASTLSSILRFVQIIIILGFTPNSSPPLSF